MSTAQMSNIYILKLTNNKWYVGKSDTIDRRLLQHSTGVGSEWTKRYPPIDIVTVYGETSPFDEDKYTKELMAQYGMDNVRGGSYCQIELDATTRQFLQRELRGANDQCFGCGGKDHFIANCPHSPNNSNNSNSPNNTNSPDTSDISDRNNRPNRPKNRGPCKRCGRNNHTVEKCYAKTDVDGDPILQCSHCGEYGHDGFLSCPQTTCSIQ
jgi:hypothetical protein